MLPFCGVEFPEFPLQIACRMSREETVNFLLQDPRVDVNQQQRSGFSALHYAVLSNNCHIVELLLANKFIDPNIRSKDGVSIKKQIVSKLTKSSLTHKPSKRTPLQLACWNFHLPVLITLLGDTRVDIDTQDEHTMSPFYVACRNGQVLVVKALLRFRKVDVSVVTILNRTPFWGACYAGSFEIVKMLIDHPDVDVMLSTTDNKSPFWAACYSGNQKIVQLLLNDSRICVMKSSISDETPFYIACRNGWCHVANILRKDPRVDVNFPNSKKETPFFGACASGNIALVQSLISDDRICTTSFSIDNLLPFSIACICGKLSVATILSELPEMEPYFTPEHMANSLRKCILRYRSQVRYSSCIDKYYIEIGALICTIGSLSPYDIVPFEQEREEIANSLKLRRSKSAFRK